MDTLPKTRAEAKTVGAAQYFTGAPCKHGHLVPKFTCSGSCVACLAERRREGMRKWAKENPELKKARAAAYYADNKEEVKQRVRDNYYRDIAASRARAREYASVNSSAAVVRVKAWKVANPERAKINDASRDPVKLHAGKAKYRASRRKACPPWVDAEHMKKINEIYSARRRIVELTGVPHEVDHILPLQGKTVCGLHVWWNLRVISKEENNRRPRIWREAVDTP